MVRGVVFDFDGTLAETRDAVAATINAVLHEAGHPRVAPSWIHHMMGLPLHTMLSKAIPRTRRPEDVSDLAAAYRACFATVGQPLVRPMPEADAVLAALSAEGLVLAIATSRESATLDPILARLGWTGRFAAISTCDRSVNGKPAPDILQRALTEAQVRPQEALMVGDTRWDMQMAEAAGVVGIGVSHGSHDAQALQESGAAAVYDDLWGVVAHLGMG